jgi:predicted porin
MYNNSQGHDLRLGMRGEFTPYLTGELTGGYAMVYFDQSNPTTSGWYGWGDSTDYESVVFSGALTNRLSRLTTQKLSFSYEPVVGYNVGNYYATYIGKYNIAHQVNDRLNLGGLIQYIYSEESGGAPRFREDHSEVWQIGGNIAYAVGKNIDLIADYTYTEKDSEARGATAKEYIQHEASVGARYTF